MNTQPRAREYKQRSPALYTLWQTFWQREDGANLVLMAFVITMLLGFAGLAVDGSNIYYQTQRMQISADAAALGGARKLAASADHNEVDAEIIQLATANDAEFVTWSYINDNRGVHVIASRSFSAYFARIYGHSVFTVTAESQAQYENVAGTGGLFPFTIDCNCEGEGSGSSGGDDDDGSSSETDLVSNPHDEDLPDSGTIELSDDQTSSYSITYVGQNANRWVYEVGKIEGNDIDHWLLGIGTCLDHVVSYTPSGAAVGTDGSTGASGIKWNVNSGFTNGTFSFVLDDSYPAGEVVALAKAGSVFGTVPIRGPICDGTNTGNGNNGGESSVTSLCLPTLDFETDTAGAALVAGQIIDTEWAAWGIRVTTNSPSKHPAMIFSTASPTGDDNDLGTPNQDYGGPGTGAGGKLGMPGANSTPLGKVLVVAERNNPVHPDDNASGGKLIFTFDNAVRVDDVQILDIDDSSAAGVIRAYSDTNGATLIATGRMLGLGDNSVQNIALSAFGVRRLEVEFPKSGALASIVSCRSGSQSTYNIGNLIWADANANHIQDGGELGIAGVALELYVSGHNYVIGKATSNVGGAYRFGSVPAGNYEIKVAASNFGTGQALAGATYSIANSGSNDGVDSDFSPSTGRASVNLVNADNLTIDGGFKVAADVPDPGAQSAVIQINDNKNSQYEVSLVSIVGNQWTYRVTEVSGHHLSEWGLGIENCIDKVVSKTPTSGYDDGLDMNTGIRGIMWSVSNSFNNGEFSFTLDDSYQPVSRQVFVKSGGNTAQMTISGPDCSTLASSVPAPEPEDDGGEGGSGDDESSGGEGCVCEEENAGFEYGVEYLLHEPEQNAPGNFGWLRWSGDQPSTTDLEYNIRHPEESDVVYIGSWVQGTTGIKNSTLVQTALEEWEGKNITIPIYDQVDGNGSNAQYRVCAFAVFQLVGYDRSTKTITGIFQRTLVHSEYTDDTVPDLGARDVRILQ